MSREWKPGDVAMISGKDGVESLALCQGGSWATPGRSFLGPTVARPLIVIDPEDREQVERLAGLAAGVYGAASIDRWQAALREFANPTPPKPDEPTGLGAVVEDAEGYRYVRGHVDASVTHPWYVIDLAASKPRGWWKWSEIDAVRVLSEGVDA